MKKELNLDTPPAGALKALVEMAETFNSDLAQIIGRDDDGKLLHVAVYARGSFAVKLERWLKQVAKAEDWPGCKKRRGSTA